MTWDPTRYERFKSERSQPFFDLLALMQPAPGACAVDLGCGTGELTRVLHERLEAAETRGIDFSEEMLARSGRSAGGGVSFERGDIAAFAAPAAHDVVFSNAALHWIPDHPALLGRLTAALRPHGQLAIQVPANHDHRAHQVARALAERAVAGGLPPTPVLPPDAYAEILHRLGYAAQVVRLEVYGHALASRDEVTEWLAGTTLTPLRTQLDAAAWTRFVEQLRQSLSRELEDARPFFYTFKRILMWARRP